MIVGFYIYSPDFDFSHEIFCLNSYSVFVSYYQIPITLNQRARNLLVANQCIFFHELNTSNEI